MNERRIRFNVWGSSIERNLDIESPEEKRKIEGYGAKGPSDNYLKRTLPMIKEAHKDMPDETIRLYNLLMGGKNGE